MSTELAERVTTDGEIVESRAPLTLFGTDDPAAVVERATKVATVLADVIKQRRLSAHIGNRDHIMLEGWTLLGSMLGVFGEVEWTRSLENGWEARAVARTMAGATVGSAEAMCTRSERTWGNRDEYAIRSMAQTRALSKALRLPLGFIVELAGFAATPAEELDGIEQPQGGERVAPGGARSAPARTRPAASPRNRGEVQQAIAEAAKARGMSFAQVEATAKRLGIKRGDASMDDLSRLLAEIEQPGSGVPSSPADTANQTDEEEARSSSSTSTPDAGGHTPAPATAPDSDGEGSSPAHAAESGPAPTDEELLAAAGPGAEIVPPKPGTPEYRALPNGSERAKAKAWWDAHKDEPEQGTLAEALGAPGSDR